MNLSHSWRAGRMNATSYTGAAEQKDRKVDNVILGLLGAILTAVVTFGVRLDIRVRAKINPVFCYMGAMV